MKSMVVIFLTVCFMVLSIKTQHIYRFEASLKSCRSDDIMKYLSEAQCVYEHFFGDFLCQFRCDMQGFMKLKDCHTNFEPSDRPKCDDLYCSQTGEETTYKNCEFITYWDSSLQCTFACDSSYNLRLTECNSNPIVNKLPLCKELHCG